MVQNAKMPIVTNPLKYLCSQKMAAIRSFLFCYEEKKIDLIGLDLHLNFRSWLWKVDVPCFCLTKCTQHTMRHDLARICLTTHALLTDKELPKLLSAWEEAWLHDPRNRVDHRQLLIVRSKIARKQLRGEWDSIPADGLVNKNPRTKFWLNLLLIVVVQ